LHEILAPLSKVTSEGSREDGIPRNSRKLLCHLTPKVQLRENHLGREYVDPVSLTILPIARSTDFDGQKLFPAIFADFEHVSFAPDSRERYVAHHSGSCFQTLVERG
jgi:hypothetical protein